VAGAGVREDDVSADVLRTKDQIGDARARMEARGLSALGVSLSPVGFIQRLRGRSPGKVGDWVKSWDVLRSVEFVEGRFPKSARVLDLGAFCCEILPALHQLGFERLAGIDLNPNVRGMPYADRVRYEVGNFLQAPFADGSFDVITSISVIEHGFDGPRLLDECARLLAPGGCFVASFDYWPEKIDTRDTKFFGLDWRIFSRAEVEAFVEDAGRRGLRPVGPVALDAQERPASAAGRDYTFGWLALEKR
jgi:SAM-dependent methyltransferase